MDKRRTKIAMKVLNEVKTEYPQTAEFIDVLLEQDVERRTCLSMR